MPVLTSILLTGGDHMRPYINIVKERIALNVGRCSDDGLLYLIDALLTNSKEV